MSELPTTFGKYFLTEKLATGGMAEIYLAKLVGPNGFEKQLVIKQIHPRLSGQRPFVDLFVTEAKTLVTLAHGNIVPVYELGVVGETYFIAMEYIDGPTLYRLTERVHQRGDRIAPAIGAWIAARILEGLDYAHRKGEGVIHRDLSPRNVMLSRDGEVKLVDFGIAVTLSEPGSADERAQSAPTGSFPYMSPEQVRKEALTPRSDLFSLGVLLWEMLTGTRLFARADADATLAAVTTSTIPRPSSAVPEVPAKLDDLVMRALERDPEARWQTAGDMLAALQRYLYALDDTPGPRDVTTLVAKYCPPELRRAPTNLEAFLDPDAPVASGPSTVVAPRPPVVGTAVIPRQRQQTFATHVDIAKLIPPTTAPHEPVVVPEPRLDQPPDSTLRIGVPGRDAPRQGTIVVAGIGALALAGGAIYVFYSGRAAVLAPDAPHVYDARPDAEIDARPPTPPDAAVIPLAVHDAGPPLADAARASRDARPPDAAPTATATAVLKVGADPWGEVTVDGIARGRTPLELAVPAGHHTVEVMFRGEDPPKLKTFPIDIAPNQTLALQADFTR